MAQQYSSGNLAEKPAIRNISSAITSRTRRKKASPEIQLNNKLRLRCMLLVVLVSVMGIFITFRNGVAASQGYDLVKIKQSVSSLEKENARLRLDIATLKSPDRIKNIAVKQAGMVLPPKVYFATKQH